MSTTILNRPETSQMFSDILWSVFMGQVQCSRSRRIVANTFPNFKNKFLYWLIYEQTFRSSLRGQDRNEFHSPGFGANMQVISIANKSYVNIKLALITVCQKHIFWTFYNAVKILWPQYTSGSESQVAPLHYLLASFQKK